MVIRTLTFYNGNRLPIVSVSHPGWRVRELSGEQIEQYVLDPATKHYQPRGEFREAIVADVLPEVRIDLKKVW